MLDGRMSEDAQSEAAAADREGAHAAPDVSTNMATPQLAQMTTSSAPTYDTSSKWICEMCTYENFPLSRKCTMCRTPKSCLGEDIFRLQDGASALPDKEDTGVECVAERLRPLRIASPASAGSVSPTPPSAPSAPVGAVGALGAAGKWPCAVCTYDNWPRSSKCAMCGAPHDNTNDHNVTSSVTSSVTMPCAPGVTGVTGMTGATGVTGVTGAAAGTARRGPADLMWLQACLGVLDGDARLVDAYLAAGGDPARALTHHEVLLLNRASAFDAGHTLVHLAIRFQRQEILSTLLSRISGGGPGLKRSPSYIAPDIASAIRRHIANSIRHKKGSFPCRYITEFSTFTLPAEIEELPGPIQEQLFSELLDRDAQQTLETDQPLINWSLDIAGSRVYALWNRSAGDCLLDAVSQCAFGVFDRHAALRRALHDSMQHAARAFYQRYQWWERAQASLLQYSPDEAQLRGEWARSLAAAAAPRTPLNQIHVWVLAHVMRRPIIVYGVNVVNSFRGEAIGFARFHGIYLPLLWESPVCKSPLALGYTRGHFSALVTIEPTADHYICRERDEQEEVNYLPLTDYEGKLLPVHFLTCEEVGSEEALVRRWMSCSSHGGVLCARQAFLPRPLLQAQMLEEWLNHYRRLAQQTRGPFPPRLHPSALHSEFSSDPDTDDE